MGQQGRVQAAAPKGQVLVRVSTAADGVVLSVADSGPGLTHEQRQRLFEPFFTTKPSGTGLGLAVSRAIAHAHGGEIEAGSATPHGALFELRLPRQAAVVGVPRLPLQPASGAA